LTGAFDVTVGEEMKGLAPVAPDYFTDSLCTPYRFVQRIVIDAGNLAGVFMTITHNVIKPF